MIKMKALRSFGYAGCNEGAVNRGHEFSTRDITRAKELEAHGLAYRIESKLPPKTQVAAPAMPVENMAAEAGPLASVGGTIGAEAPVPSSLPGRRRRGRRSSNSAADLLS